MIRSLNLRLLVGYVMITITVVIVWVATAMSTHSVHQNYSRTVHTVDALAENVLLRAKLMDDQETGLRGYLLTGVPEFLQPYRAGQASLKSARMNTTQLEAAEPGVRPLLVPLLQRALAWETWATTILRVTRPGQGSSAALVARQRQGKVLFDAYRASSARVTTYLDAQRTQALAESERLLNALEVFLTLGFVASIVVMALVGWRTIQAVTAPLAALGEMATAMGGGELDHVIGLGTGADKEFVTLAGSMDHMREQLRQSVERLRASEQRFRSVTDAAAEAIISADAEGTALSWNTGARTIFGYDEGEMVGQKLEMLMPERYRAAHRAGLQRVEETGQSHLVGHTVELAGVRKDGTEFPLELSLGTWEVEGVTFFSGIIRDITTRKQAEAELIAAREAAVESSRMKSEFLASMSHEIRTPMSGVIGMTDLLLDTPLNPEQREYAITVQESAQALLAIINDILDFSKIEAGRMTLESIECPLADLVEGVADLMAPRAREKGLALMTYIDPSLPARVLTDTGRLRQILLNLLSNAVKFTEAGQVVVRVTPLRRVGEQVTVRFAVTDTGIGLSETARRRLFQPFTQADGSTTRRYGGTGLGLSISRRLVELMGGEITVDSTEGVGSTFWFTLQLSAVPEDVPAAVLAELAELHVLVVDDSATDQAILMAYLESWGMHTEVAGGGAEALARLRARTDTATTVVLIDLAMPVMDGFALARAIQREPGWADRARLILITGYDERGQGEQALAAGFSAYLTKPIKRSYLLDAIAGSLAAPVQHVEFAASPAALRRDEQTAVARVERDDAQILVAEDNAVNRTLVVAQLAKLGLKAEVVGTGRAAVGAAAAGGYALVLMDCQMPDVDGFEATKMIRKQEARTGQHVPIVALTANAMKGDRERCLAAGMDDYLAKPVDGAALRSALERWLPGFREGAGGRGSRTAARQSGEEAAGGALASTGGAVLDEALLADLQALADAHDPHLVADLIGIYLTEAPELLAVARQRVAEGDAEGATGAAHKLKGSSASMGVIAMARLCGQLEEAGRRGDLTEAGALLEQVEATYAQVAPALRDHLS